MRGWMLHSLVIHATVLLAALGFAMPVREVSMPRVATVSIENAATPPDSADPQDVSMPRPTTPPQVMPPRPDTGELYVPPEPVIEPEPDSPEIPPESPAGATRDPAPTPKPLRRPDQLPPTPDPVPQTDAAVPVAPSAPAQAGPLDSSVCDRAPLLARVDWPRNVRRMFEGRVEIRVEVDRQGKAVSVDLLRGTGHQNWDQALLEAMRGAVYLPAVKDHHPVPSRHTFRIEFARE